MSELPLVSIKPRVLEEREMGSMERDVTAGCSSVSHSCARHQERCSMKTLPP